VIISSVASPNSTVDRIRAQFLPWPFACAIRGHKPITARPKTIASVMSVFTSLTWAAVRRGVAVRSAALMAEMSASEMIKVPVLTAASASMSLAAVSWTGTGTGGRRGSAGWLLDG
jgi:hypothetical protein